MKRAFCVDTYLDLLALHRALMEAKFTTEPWDTVVPESPYLARFSNEVPDVLIEAAREQSADEHARWKEWRVFTRARREWRIVEQRISACNSWRAWTPAQKRAYVLDQISPFVEGDGNVMDELLDYGNSCHSSGPS